MNEVQVVDFRPLVQQRPRLSKGQEKLYKLICEICKDSSKKLSLEKAMEIYKSVGCGSHSWSVRIELSPNNYKWENRNSVWNEWQWKQNFMNWILRALGALVMKGYLTVIPAIDFNECPGCETTLRKIG